ncbi:MAG TPA: glycosyltransferase family 4 protein [Candidatus Paceibacterota bacterium]|nr:glycosyltransferase family 4 protein [Candidatus Paceibacterota bacterium]
MRTRILVFSTDDHLFPAGGAEQAFGNIAERLPQIEFDLICARLRPGVPKEETVGNVHIRRVGFGVPKLDGILLALFGHRVALRLMRKHQYSLMWSIMASYGAFAAVRVKKRTNIPFLLTLQEGDSLEHIYERVRYVRGSFDEIFKLADGVQAISTFLLLWAREMGFRGALGKVIPNGVDLKLFSKPYDGSDIKEMRESFNFPDGAFILVTSSRLERKNGIGDVLMALSELPPHVCFVICGSGSLEQGLREYVREHDLSKRVRFMGFVEPAKLPLILRATDAFIRPSLSEGLGNAFLEAMSVRLPVIGTNAGGIPDFLKDRETGFVVEIGSPVSIREKVLELMALHPSEKEAILKRAEALVRERYDWDLVAHSMEMLFKEVVP